MSVVGEIQNEGRPPEEDGPKRYCGDSKPRKTKAALIKRYVIANEDKIDPVEAGDLADEF